jgi:hypothetical protein
MGDEPVKTRSKKIWGDITHKWWLVAGWWLLLGFYKLLWWGIWNNPIWEPQPFRLLSANITEARSFKDPRWNRRASRRQPRWHGRRRLFGKVYVCCGGVFGFLGWLRLFFSSLFPEGHSIRRWPVQMKTSSVRACRIAAVRCGPWWWHGLRLKLDIGEGRGRVVFQTMVSLYR